MKTVLWFIGAALSVMCMFKAIAALTIYDDATLIHTATSCQVISSQSVTLSKEDSICATKGRLSVEFFSGDYMLELPNGNTLVMSKPGTTHMYSSDSVRYEPFRSIPALFSLIGVLLFWCAYFYSAYRDIFNGRKEFDPLTAAGRK